MVKHLYQRTITHYGKKVKAWYFWFLDKNGKRIRRTCGKNGKPCLTKKEAQSFIELLDDNELLKENITFNQFAINFFTESSFYIKKQKLKGYEYEAHTLKDKQRILDKFLEKFGEKLVTNISIGELEKWVFSLPYSPGYLNRIIAVINIVLYELYRAEHLDKIIKMDKCLERKIRNKGILYPDEIKRLFPDTKEEICEVWGNKKNTDEENFTTAVLIYTILTTGMRGCEGRAIQYSQFIQKDVILINAMLNHNGERVEHLKKGNEIDKRWRIAILPEKTIELINKVQRVNQNNGENDYVFSLHGKPFSRTLLNNKFKKICLKNGINATERNLSIHSLRYTYNTMMRHQISGESLRMMLGHLNPKMTEYYDRAKITDKLPLLLQNKDVINNMWN